jgi:multiple sugar transport system permease protein
VDQHLAGPYPAPPWEQPDLLFRQFYADIPQDYLDASRAGGASGLRVLTSIVAPMSKPVLTTASLLLFLGQWNSFF